MEKNTGKPVPRIALYSIPPRENPTTIGLGTEAASFAQTPQWKEFFDERGYTVTQWLSKAAGMQNILK